MMKKLKNKLILNRINKSIKDFKDSELKNFFEDHTKVKT